MCAPRADLRRVRRRFARRATRTPPPCASPRAADRLRDRRQPRRRFESPSKRLHRLREPRGVRVTRVHARAELRELRVETFEPPSRSPPRPRGAVPTPSASVSLRALSRSEPSKTRQTPRRPPRARFRRRAPLQPRRLVPERLQSPLVRQLQLAHRAHLRAKFVVVRLASDTPLATPRTPPPLATPPRGNLPSRRRFYPTPFARHPPRAWAPPPSAVFRRFEPRRGHPRRRASTPARRSSAASTSASVARSCASAHARNCASRTPTSRAAVEVA